MEQIIQKRFDCDLALLRANRKQAQAQAALRQAKFDLREAKAAQLEYGGSFRAFRDKFTGKREESETRLRHAVEKAESDASAAQRNWDNLSEEIQNLEAALTQLPPWESLKTEENETLWCQLEARYCAEWLIPHLEITHQLLLERRAQFNGSNAGQIKTLTELADIYSAPEAAAEDCVPYIRRLKSALNFLGKDFPEFAFFDAPTVFLSSATQYTRMDRINTAIAHTEKFLQAILSWQEVFHAE